MREWLHRCMQVVSFSAHQGPCFPLFPQVSEKKNRWVSANYSFFRMHRISDIYFVGGFGTVQWVDVGEYVAARPDEIAAADPHHTLQVTPLFL